MRRTFAQPFEAPGYGRLVARSSLDVEYQRCAIGANLLARLPANGSGARASMRRPRRRSTADRSRASMPLDCAARRPRRPFGRLIGSACQMCRFAGRIPASEKTGYTLILASRRLEPLTALSSGICDLAPIGSRAPLAVCYGFRGRLDWQAPAIELGGLAMSSNGSSARERERIEAQRFARLRTVWLIEDAAPDDEESPLALAMRTAAAIARPQVAPRRQA
jgi:hypothetical protein